MNDMLIGAIVTASLIAALFFLRFWRSTGDRFFLFFSLAFASDAVNRLLLGAATVDSDDMPAYYIIRLLGYGLILFAIYDKNRPRS
ncbi:DUF5985 family protein [Noviherbaspirillum saxi]|uniref:Uncharacterized protein n=1 Tax=Noviherbaspirillum saxi TaxID=2320863 RepID=A0A3A3FSS8_9BURK|nr:DUF5985 family protein [Noviherbaspirillum saxi]RJF97251.1 hypothetical protein D3871_00900 [Noviherbaspirillum saxi]